MKGERERWRFSLSSLMMTVSVVAVFLAVLPYPMIGFYVILFILFMSAVLSRVGPVEQRTFWFAFAIFGWLYVTLGVTLLESFERTPQWFQLRSWILKQSWGWWGWKPEHYLLAAHGLLALLVSFFGALIVGWLRATSKAFNPEAQGREAHPGSRRK